jgi:dihydrofolate reductase
MRTLIVSNIISIDGYYEGPGGNVMALPMDASFNAYNVERLRAADTLLLGANTFRGFAAYWPPVADDPSADEDNREISRLNGAIDKLAISDSLTASDAGAWADTSRIVSRADAHDAIRELKQHDGGEILMFGSRTTWHDLFKAGLVDELHIMVGGAVLGGGTPAFPDGAAATLELLGTRTSDGSDNVLVRYGVRRD